MSIIYNHFHWYIWYCRNVLKATIEVPWAGDLHFNCTQLDHLDEYWRMLQIRAIVQSFDPPHILAGGLNSLNQADYSTERWMDIVKVYIYNYCVNTTAYIHTYIYVYSFIVSLTSVNCCNCTQYYEDKGKPKPKVEVMKFLNGNQYVDANNFAADCEPVVIIAKGQSIYTYFLLLLPIII